jgi:hypothetical protein
MSEDNQETGLRIIGDAAPLFEALSKAQLEFLPIVKNRTVKVRPRKRDDGYQPPEYSFDYATLDEVQDKTRPALNKHGLSILQPFFDVAGDRWLRTILAHSSGSRVEIDVRLPQARDIQETGKAITYVKRYQWAAALGVNSEEDDDGNAHDGNQVTESRDRSKAPTPKAAPKPVPAKEPELRTAPISDRPPPPDSDADQPCPKSISQEIGEVFRRLGMHRTETVVMCKEVTGKAPAEMTLRDGEMLLAHVKKLEAAERQAKAEMPGNAG